MADNKYILALDQGTTSSRAIIFDHSGTIVAQSNQEFEQIFPRPGWVEHNPEDIWSSQINVARKVMQTTGSARRRLRRNRHHQPARDHRRVGPHHRPADPQRHRLAGPPHRRLSATN